MLKRFVLLIGCAVLCTTAKSQLPGTGASGSNPVQAPPAQPQGIGGGLGQIEKSLAPLGAIQRIEARDQQVRDLAASALQRNQETPGVLIMVERRGAGFDNNEDAERYSVDFGGFGNPLEAIGTSTRGIRESRYGPITERYGIYVAADGRSTVITRARLERGERVSQALQAAQLHQETEDRQYAIKVRAAKGAERQQLQAEHAKDLEKRKEREDRVERFAELSEKAEEDKTAQEKAELTSMVEEEERKQSVARTFQNDDPASGASSYWDEKTIKNDPVGFMLQVQEDLSRQKFDPLAPYVRQINDPSQRKVDRFGAPRIEADLPKKSPKY